MLTIHTSKPCCYASILPVLGLLPSPRPQPAPPSDGFSVLSFLLVRVEQSWSPTSQPTNHPPSQLPNQPANKPSKFDHHNKFYLCNSIHPTRQPPTQPTNQPTSHSPTQPNPHEPIRPAVPPPDSPPNSSATGCASARRPRDPAPRCRDAPPANSAAGARVPGSQPAGKVKNGYR